MPTACSPTPCLFVHNAVSCAAFIFLLNCTSAPRSSSDVALLIIIFVIFLRVIFLLKSCSLSSHVAIVIDAAVFGAEAFDGQAGGPLAMVAALALLLPNLAVAVRRLRDTDRSGWWILVLLIPIIGYLIFLYWLVQPTYEGENRFGEPSQ